jgi:hypothetical protein
MPYKMYYPRAGGTWPLRSTRLLWVRPLQWWSRFTGRAGRAGIGGTVDGRFRDSESWSEDWQVSGMRLPSMQRLGHATRWCVPVDENLTRVLYAKPRRINTAFGRLVERILWRGFLEWRFCYNFSDQDYDSMRSCRWQYPEYLSSTDSHVVAERRLVAEHARGIRKPVEVKEVTTAEQQVVEAHELLGARTEEDYGQIARPAGEEVMVKTELGSSKD